MVKEYSNNIKYNDAINVFRLHLQELLAQEGIEFFIKKVELPREQILTVVNTDAQLDKKEEILKFKRLFNRDTGWVMDNLLKSIMPESLKALCLEIDSLRREKRWKFITERTGLNRQLLDYYLKGRYYPDRVTLAKLGAVIPSQMIDAVTRELYGVSLGNDKLFPDDLSHLTADWEEVDKIAAITILSSSLSNEGLIEAIRILSTTFNH